MAHELSIQNGAAEMFSARNIVPWHGLGTVVKDLATAEEAIRLAHLDWQVVRRPVAVDGKTLPFPDKEGTDDRWQAITRADTGDVLGILKGRYTPIQNVDSFSFFDRLVGGGKAVYDTAGALRGGRQVWLMAKIDGARIINGDEHETYGLMVTSHDGSYALSVSFVTTRVVCANTLSVALKGAKNMVKIRHTENWRNAEEEARRVLGIGEKYFDTIQEALANLGQHLLTPPQMEDFTKLLIPCADEKDVPTRTQNIRNEINRLFERGPGNKGATRWDALNAVTDYADHYQTMRTSGGSTRLESAILGSGAQLKQKAFEYLSSEEIMQDLLNRPHAVAATASNHNTGASDFDRLLGGN